jgi:hypothetical protein
MKTFGVLLTEELVTKAIVFTSPSLTRKFDDVHTPLRGHHSGTGDRRNTTWPLPLKGLNLISLLGERKSPETAFCGVTRSVPRKKESKWSK